MSTGRKITRNEFKLLLNFYRWGQPRYYDKVRRIVTLLTSEPMLTLVPDPWPQSSPSRAELKAAFKKYKTAMLLANTGLKWAITDRNAKRAVLQGLLGSVAVHLESVAKHTNNLSFLAGTGFDQQHPIVHHPIAGMVSAPELKVKHGTVSGTLLGTAKWLGRDVVYEIQIATGDRAVDANYEPVTVSKQSRNIEIPKLTPGQLYHVRLRALGRHGYSPWSQVISRYAN